LEKAKEKEKIEKKEKAKPKHTTVNTKVFYDRLVKQHGTKYPEEFYAKWAKAMALCVNGVDLWTPPILKDDEDMVGQEEWARDLFRDHSRRQYCANPLEPLDKVGPQRKKQKLVKEEKGVPPKRQQQQHQQQHPLLQDQMELLLKAQQLLDLQFPRMQATTTETTIPAPGTTPVTVPVPGLGTTTTPLPGTTLTPGTALPGTVLTPLPVPALTSLPGTALTSLPGTALTPLPGTLTSLSGQPLPGITTVTTRTVPRKKVGLLINGTPDLGIFKGLKSQMVAMVSTGICSDVISYLKNLFHIPVQCDISIEMKQGTGRATVTPDFPVLLMESASLYLVEKSIDIIVKKEGKEEQKLQVPERDWVTMQFKNILEMFKGEELSKIAVVQSNGSSFPVADAEDMCADFLYTTFFLS